MSADKGNMNCPICGRKIRGTVVTRDPKRPVAYRKHEALGSGKKCDAGRVYDGHFYPGWAK